MNRFMGEALWFIKKNLWTSLTLFFFIFLCAFLGIFALHTNDNLQMDTDTYNKTQGDYQFYRLIDSFESAEGQRFTAQSDSTLKLMALYEKLAQRKGEFLEISFNWGQSVYNLNGCKTCLMGYESGSETSGIKTDKGTAYTMKTVLLGMDIRDIFHLQIKDGRWFSEDEYEISPDATVVPVILGNAYSESYAVGDTLSVSGSLTSSQTKKLQVIGILQKNSIINNGLEPTKLDRYMIFPSYHARSINLTDDSNWVLYYCKLFGVFRTDKTANEINNDIAQYCTEVGMPVLYTVEGADNYTLTMFNASVEQVSNAFFFISIFLFIFTAILLIAAMTMFVKKNLKYFSILLINRFDYRGLYGLLYLISFIYCFTGFIAAALASLILLHRFGMDNQLIFYAAVSGSLCLLALFAGYIAVWVLKKNDLSEYIRKK